jgi:hypothetical protein
MPVRLLLAIVLPLCLLVAILMPMPCILIFVVCLTTCLH